MDPVIAADGYTYERHAVKKLLKWSKKYLFSSPLLLFWLTCRYPVTRAEFTSTQLLPNYTLLRQMQSIKVSPLLGSSPTNSLMQPRLIHKKVPWLDILPNWLLFELFQFLDYRSLVAISKVVCAKGEWRVDVNVPSQVCNGYTKIANDSRLWAALLNREFSPTAVATNNGGPALTSSKEKFVYLYKQIAKKKPSQESHSVSDVGVHLVRVT